MSGVNLNAEVAITSSNYNYTDFLLPHDDQCEGRKFAFTLYLTPDWEETDGGQLLMYDCDGEILMLLKSLISHSRILISILLLYYCDITHLDNNNPISVAQITNPVENMLILFEVSPRSWHMVTEVFF